MYKQFTSNCTLRKNFFYKLYDFERIILQLEQFVAAIITLVNNSQGI